MKTVVHFVGHTASLARCPRTVPEYDSLWALKWTQLFSKYSHQNLGKVPVLRCKVSTFFSGTKWYLGLWKTPQTTQHYFVPVWKQPLLHHTRWFIQTNQNNRIIDQGLTFEGKEISAVQTGVEYTYHFAFGFTFFCRFLSSSRITVGLYTSFSCIWATTDCITLQNSSKAGRYVSYYELYQKQIYEPGVVLYKSLVGLCRWATPYPILDHDTLDFAALF